MLSLELLDESFRRLVTIVLMPGLLQQEPLDLHTAARRLEELARRARQLAALGVLLAVAAAILISVSPAGPGVPLGVGALAAFGLSGIARTDRRRLLVRLVAQGDALAIGSVRAYGARLSSRRERERLAQGLRLALRVIAPGSQVQIMVDPGRVDDCAPRLRGLADSVADPRVSCSPQALALCGQLLHDPTRSPLCNPHVPTRELWRILDLVEQGLGITPSR